jgi:hypothetical protein
MSADALDFQPHFVAGAPEFRKGRGSLGRVDWRRRLNLDE